MTADVKLDDAASAAKAEIGAEALTRALNEAVAGEDGNGRPAEPYSEQAL
ncbi:hypothetical protein PV433_30525 [Paenibacillus sp. GYB004]